MRVFSVLLAVSLLLLGAGCATTTDRAAPVPVSLKGVQLPTTALVEALLAEKGTRVQAVNGTYRDDAFQAHCVMKGDGEKLTVVFLAPQLRLVTIDVTKPHAIHCERAPQIPAAFEPEYALVDLAFVNLPLDRLRASVSPVLTVVEDGNVRRISAADGSPVAELTTAEDGTLSYRNCVYGYSYTLKNLR